MKNAVERFEFETRGLESVSQRVADVRAALSDFETRFKTLSESGHTIEELKSQAQAMTGQMKIISDELGKSGQDAKQLQALRRELDEAQAASRELSAQVARLDEVRPALDAALRDVEQLGRSHATVKDALEDTQRVEAEIARARESHYRDPFLAGLGRDVAGRARRNSVGELRKVTPTIELVQKQARDVSESVAAIESRRDFLEELRRRMADLEPSALNLDERGRQLQSRMEAAEQNFVGLIARADEAERTNKAMSAMSASLQQAQARADEIAKTIEAIEERSESVEGSRSSRGCSSRSWSSASTRSRTPPRTCSGLRRCGRRRRLRRSSSTRPPSGWPPR